MLTHPFIDPILLQIGPLTIHWYGVMYIIALVCFFFIARWRSNHTYYKQLINQKILDDILFYVMLGTICGGRIGYVLFYNLPQFLADPLWLFRVWEGGMSFHGGMLGVIAGMLWVCKKHTLRPFAVLDFIAPMAALGLFFGRLGNFIGGELYGHPTDVPWGVVFPHAGDLPRHPSQVYEAISEGLVLAGFLFIYSIKPRPIMSVSGYFLIGYGVFRFLIEFVREPDVHLGYLAFGWLTMGQILTSPMVLFGCILLFLAYRNNISPVSRH